MVNLALDSIGYGRFQWTLFACAGLGWLCMNTILQGLAISLPFLAREFAKTEQEAREATLSLSIGMIFGAFFWSEWSDRRGRRESYRWTILVAGFSVACAAFMPDWHALCAFLALAGTGVGGSLVVDGVLFVELVPPSETRKLASDQQSQGGS